MIGRKAQKRKKYSKMCATRLKFLLWREDAQAERVDEHYRISTNQQQQSATSFQRILNQSAGKSRTKISLSKSIQGIKGNNSFCQMWDHFKNAQVRNHENIYQAALPGQCAYCRKIQSKSNLPR